MGGKSRNPVVRFSFSLETKFKYAEKKLTIGLNVDEHLKSTALGKLKGYSKLTLIIYIICGLFT